MKPGGRKIWRWIFNAATLLSLLLCVAFCVGRARSWYGAEKFGNGGFTSSPSGMDSKYSYWVVTSERGILLFEQVCVRPTGSVFLNGFFTHSGGQLRGYNRVPEGLRVIRSGSAWNDYGFFGTYNTQSRFEWFGGAPSKTTELRIGAPYWFLIVLAAVLPLRAVPGLLTRRLKPGMCRRCGYDLRGSTASAACPECGEAIPNQLLDPEARP